MVKKSSAGARWPIVALIAVVAAAAVYFFWPGEERRVRAQLGSLADSLGIPAHEADLARLARASRARHYFSEDVAVDFEGGFPPSVRGRESIAGLVARPWAEPSGVRIELEDVRISLDESRTTADARFKARVVSLDPAKDPPTIDGRTVSLTLRRVEGTWLVSSARIMQSDDALR